MSGENRSSPGPGGGCKTDRGAGWGPPADTPELGAALLMESSGWQGAAAREGGGEGPRGGPGFNPLGPVKGLGRGASGSPSRWEWGCPRKRVGGHVSVTAAGGARAAGGAGVGAV